MNAILKELTPLQLQSLTVGEQIDLMQALRPSSEGAKKSPEIRQAQRTLYCAMKLQEDFLNVEAEGRRQMTEDLIQKNRKLLLEAKKKWGDKPQTEELIGLKKRTLEAVVKAQCKAFGFQRLPVKLEAFNEGDEADIGGYRPATNRKPPKIVLNMDSYAINDFELMLDTVIHENHHHFQQTLILRLHLPEDDDDVIKPGHPLYQQAKLFELNSEDGAYVGPEESHKAEEENSGPPGSYQKQPLERHAHYSGPLTARGLVKALA